MIQENPGPVTEDLLGSGRTSSQKDEERLERMSPERWNELADVGTDDAPKKKVEWTCLVPHERLWKGLTRGLANTQVAPQDKRVRLVKKTRWTRLSL